MAIDSLNNACSAYLRSEEQLSKQYRSVKMGLPALPWTPEPRLHHKAYISPSHIRLVKRLHPQSKPRVSCKQTLELLRSPIALAQRKKPAGFKISDPRFTSPTWKGRTPEKRVFDSSRMVTLLEDWPRTPRCVREPEMRIAYKVGTEIKVDDRIRELSKDMRTCGQLFPARGRRHQPRTLQECDSEKSTCTFTKSLSAKKMQCRSKSPLPFRHDCSTKLADEDDEFKCVIEGDYRYPFIHL